MASLLLAACGGSEAIPGTQARFELGATLWDGPMPGAHLRDAEGRVRLRGLPNPLGIRLVTDLRRLIERDADGFAVSATVYFPFDGALDPESLPEVAETLDAEGAVQVIDVDPDSPERGRRFPLEVGFLADGGPFGAPDLLAALPVQGIPLREGTRYAAVVTRAIRDAAGEPIGVPRAVRRLMLDGDAGDLPPRAQEAFLSAAEEVVRQGLDPEAVAALTAFRTGRPTRDLARHVEDLAGRGPPRLTRPFTLTDRFERFCVFEAETRVPVYQRGEPPYDVEGGGWDLSGPPTVQTEAESRLVLSLPRGAGAARLPVAVFIRTGGGGDRPLVDRGVRAEPGGEAITPGTGPALELAKVGMAGLSWDGPHGGLRSEGGDEQFVVFNFVNPEALRDNLRQTAVEATWLLGLLPELTITSTACGLDGVRLEDERAGLVGHSMGATIAPLAAAFEPRFEAVVLSGAGGSWIENVVHKERPIAVRPFAEILLDYDDLGRTLGPLDPALALLQWAGEPADPPLYGARVAAGARHVLMFQGIADRYIPPPVADPLSLALGLDLAGPVLDRRFVDRAPWVGAGTRPLPVQGNRAGGAATRVLTQHPEGPVEGGHEVVFQTEPPKRQYRCFLGDWADGRVPAVPGENGCP